MPVRRTTHGKRAADADASDDLYDEEEPIDEEDDTSDDELDDELEADFDEDEPEEEAPRDRRRTRSISAATAGQAGLRLIAGLTGKEPEGVTFVQPEQDGWRVGVEVVEDRRVPSSGDLLAIYEAEMDRRGDLLSYRRTRRYKRGKGDDG